MERSANRSESSRRNHFTVLFVVLLMPPVLRLPSSADIRLPGQCASRAIPTLTLKPSRPNGIFLRYAADKACPDIGSLYRRPPPPSALETQSPFTHLRPPPRHRHRHSRPNRLSRQVERGAGPELPHASTCRARSLASTCGAPIAFATGAPHALSY